MTTYLNEKLEPYLARKVRNDALPQEEKEQILLAISQQQNKLLITRSENTRKTSSTYDISDELDSYDKTIADISQATFARKHKISLCNPIQSCQNKIHSDLQETMLSILKG